MKTLLIIGIIIFSFLSGVCGTLSFNAFENENKKEGEDGFSCMLGFLTLSIVLSLVLGIYF